MKWPEELVIVRHGKSAYNDLNEKKKEHLLYQKFLREFERAWASPETRDLAMEVKEQGVLVLNISDYETPLTCEGIRQAEETGRNLASHIKLPEIIYVSPYLRTRQTFEWMVKGWPHLGKVQEIYFDERLREKEHGILTLYNDWRLFHVLHPEEKELFDLKGEYFYSYPGGENNPRVRERTGLWIGTLIREFSERRVLVITHHVVILALRANLERLSPEEFMLLDETEKPINCGVTRYKGDPKQGRDGRLVLMSYNRKLY